VQIGVLYSYHDRHRESSPAQYRPSRKLDDAEVIALLEARMRDCPEGAVGERDIEVWKTTEEAILDILSPSH
jgi:hypothetical protein